MAKEDDVLGTFQKETTLVTHYPMDPEDIVGHYSNHAQTAFLSDEVYIDFCQIQPQEIRPKEDVEGGKLKRVPSRFQTRVIMKQEAAVNLAKSILAHYGYKVELVQKGETP